MSEVVKKPSRIFLLAIAWGLLLAAFGFLPGILRGASLVSISFDLRDYLLRAFVVFMAVHIAIRQTSLPALLVVPPLTFLLWQGIDVYEFSEWYSQSYRVNLHELNAQLFVVPVQIGIAIAGLVLCLRKSSKTTSRVFATIMMWGSIISTLLFHLSIVEVSYKPVEAVYADMLKRTSTAENYEETCLIMAMDCKSGPVGLVDFSEVWELDPQLRLHEPELVKQLANEQTWVSVDSNGEMQAGLATVDKYMIRVVTQTLPEFFAKPLEMFIFDGGECPPEALCNTRLEDMNSNASSKMLDILESAKSSESFAHAWLEGRAVDEHNPALLWLNVLGKTEGEYRFATAPLPYELHEMLTAAHGKTECQAPDCLGQVAFDFISKRFPPDLNTLANAVTVGKYKPLYFSWVDKALSRNPTKYIDRPEFLRSLTYVDGHLRLTTTPASFSKITLDMKVTFNLIITIFSTAWLVLGVFLILFHSRRSLTLR